MNDELAKAVERTLTLHMNYEGEKLVKGFSRGGSRGAGYLQIMDNLAINYPANTYGERLHLLCADYYKTIGVTELKEALAYIKEKYDTTSKDTPQSS